MNAATPFFAIEQTIAKATSTPPTFSTAWGDVAWGAEWLTESAFFTTQTILASDMGYRTNATDTPALTPYPPRVQQAFAFDTEMDLDPTQSNVSAAWGTIELANSPAKYDALVSGGWFPDGQTVRVLWGTKTFDETRGIFLDPSYSTLVDIFSGVGGPWQLTDDTLSITLRDASYWLDRPLPRATYAGSGGYEGTAALAGTLKPLVIGGVVPVPGPLAAVKNVTPILIDPVNLVYQVSASPCQITALYEGGLAGGIAFDVDVSDLYTGSTPSGQYRTAQTLGAFQLGSIPVHQITCDVIDLALAMDGATYVPVQQMVYYILVTLCGVPSTLVASADGVQISLIGSQTNPSLGDVGLFLGPNDAPTGAAFLSRILANLGGFLVPCADAKLRLYFPAALVGTETVAAAFDDHNVMSIVPVPLPATVDPPPYRVRVGYDTNYTVQTSDLNATIDQTHKQTIAQPVLVGQANSSFLAAGLARANDLPILGQSGCLLSKGLQLSGQQAAIANAARIAGLWGVRRRTYDATVPFQLATALDFGSVVNLTFGFDDLSSGKRGQIVGRSFRSQDGQIKLRVLV